MSRRFWQVLALFGVVVRLPALWPAWPALPLLLTGGVWLGRSWRRDSPCPEPPLGLLLLTSPTLLQLLLWFAFPDGLPRAALDRVEPPLSWLGHLAMLVWAWPDGPPGLNRAVPRLAVQRPGQGRA